MKTAPFTINGFTVSELVYLARHIVGSVLGLCVGVLLFVPNLLLGGGVFRGLQFCLEECDHNFDGNGPPQFDEED